LYLKETVEQWTGIKVSIGVAPTKVLSKVANRLAKKHKQLTNCILVLDTPRKTEQALQKTPIEDVWGVGYQYATKLRRLQINTALDLSKQSIEWAHRNLGGVVGMRLIRELSGEESMRMNDERTQKKMISTTRMFVSPVTDIKAIKEAVATYTARAAEKLRRQHGAATMISVFVVPKEQSHNTYFKHGPTIGDQLLLPVATSITHELIKPAIQLVEKLFEPGRIYKKAGVMLSHIVPDNTIQGTLFNPPTTAKNRMLMSAIDNVNFAMRDDMLKFASSGTTRNWKMRQELRSNRYTSRWEEICKVK
jgi:DNA polymerase V